jgi:uncharacterized membrane protein
MGPILVLSAVGLLSPAHLPDRRAVLGAAASATFMPSLPVAAWCGEQYPPWAYYLKWDELAVPFAVGEAKGEVICRIVGDIAREQKSGCPPLIIVGTPGLGYEYMENLEALTVSDRRVVEVTFAGTRSQIAPELRTVEACIAQLVAVCAALKLSRVHVVAHGLGCVVALRLAQQLRGATQALAVLSLTLVSPYGSTSDLRPEARAAVGDGSSAAGLCGGPACRITLNAATSLA